MRQRLLLIAFAASGAAGLAYESLWAKYLSLLLGHAAPAQAFVLIVFMAGLAAGAHLAGQLMHRITSPWRAYALVEAGIGVAAALFHPLFVLAQTWLLQDVAPGLGSSELLSLLEGVIAVILVLPQAMLVGATFPLMVRVYQPRNADGQGVASVYFVNSLGAAIGVLLSGFVLVPQLGLPGTLLLAAGINLVVALCCWRFAADEVPKRSTTAPARLRMAHLPLVVVAAGTGFASFLYEIAWIRMLNLVLGSTVHAFELMLSAFIAGLALGGWWVRRRILGFRDPQAVLACVQIVMGLAAVSTLLLYNNTFDWMAAAVELLPRSEAGYVQFNLVSHAIAFAIMLPATVMAGMTLPLVSHLALGRGAGEGALGHLYGANTLGGLLGVLAAVHLLLPVVGLKNVVFVGAVVDVSLGMWLLGWSVSWRTLGGMCGVVACLLLGGLARFDPLRMASGVYLRGEIDEGRELLFHRDGKTASVDVVRNGAFTAILTNGKVDAAVRDGRPSKDEPTMTLLAALPLALHAQPARVAVIGLGSGMTTDVVLRSPEVREVVTVEIEAAMVEGARWFAGWNRRAFDDPRSRILIDDARSVLSRDAQGFDVIISEPSNPWISGVAGLFSAEHYQVAARSLRPGGLLVQWVHLYSFSPELLAMVAAGLGDAFPHYALYALNDTDLAIIASQQPLPALADSMFAAPPMRSALAHVGVDGLADIQHRYLGNAEVLAPMFASYGVPPHSDFHPRMPYGAARARYLGQRGTEIQDLRQAPVDVLGMLGAAPREVRALGRNYALRSAADAREARFQTGRYAQQWQRLTDPDCARVPREFRAEALLQAAAMAMPHISPKAWLSRLDSVPPRSCLPHRWLDFLRALSLGRYDDAQTLLTLDMRRQLTGRWWRYAALIDRLAGAKPAATAPDDARAMLVRLLESNVVP